MKLIKTPCGLHCIKLVDFGVRFGDEVILEGVNLHIHCGTLTAVIGQNGAGKSTLVRAVVGDVKHTGKIEFKDRENGELKKIKIGYVPQKLNVDKNTPLSVYDMMASLCSKVPVFLTKGAKIEEKIKEALSVFDAEDLIDMPIGNLSGGQMQRVMLATAIMDRPNLLVLDEAISGVDAIGTQQFYHIIDELKTKCDMAILLISHDLNYVAKYADQVVLLDRGVLKQGKAGEVLTSKEFQTVFEGFSFKEKHEEGRAE